MMMNDIPDFISFCVFSSAAGCIPIQNLKNKFEKLVHLVGFVTRKKQKCINPLKAELNPICNLLALLGAHHILHISRIMVNFSNNDFNLHKLSHLQLR